MCTIDEFRDRFKEIREKSRWKVRELSVALGRKGHYISNFEKGVEDISVNDFLRACEILRVSPILFFAKEEIDERFEYEKQAKRIEELPNQMGQFLKWYFSLKRK